MMTPILLQALKPNVDKGDLFMSQFGLALALLVLAFLIGYLLIIIAKRVIVVMNALSAPSRLSAKGKHKRDDSQDPWAESSNRMSPVVFMPGSDGGQSHGDAGDSHHHRGHGHHGDDSGHGGHDGDGGPDHDSGSSDSGPSDSGPSDSGGGFDSGPSDSGGGSSDSGGGGSSDSSN